MNTDANTEVDDAVFVENVEKDYRTMLELQQDVAPQSSVHDQIELVELIVEEPGDLAWVLPGTIPPAFIHVISSYTSLTLKFH